MIYQNTLGGPRAQNIRGLAGDVGLLGLQVRLRDGLGAYFWSSLSVVDVFIDIFFKLFAFCASLGLFLGGSGPPLNH